MQETKKLPKRIFVLRNNDLGDVLVTTPLLEGLRLCYPKSLISVGVGDWAKSLLQGNPNINEIRTCNAPWHNKQNCNFPANSPRTFLDGLSFILLSKQSRNLTRERFTHGIDVLGSRQGAWLMLRAGIKSRFGVKGYAGGNQWCEDYVKFDEKRNVAEAALAFLPLIGCHKQVEPRPQIFLSKQEKEVGRKMWNTQSSRTKRIVIAPGGGFPEKCWGDSRFTELTNLLLKEDNLQVCILGSQEDRNRIKYQKNLRYKRIQNFCGTLDLRKSAALISEADFVFTNSSLCMHLAGAFKISSITLLGDCFDSANLHQSQWGYIESQVLGKEISIGKNALVSANEAYACFQNTFQNQTI
ncbi:MAG: glycosyltransferase family 9 protein [Opitutae bacterium]|jgi:ADP-heptose:LPS heptosyltransferase|nr:glycosyltransferase family 9 protein [Opitutae bacterium]